VFACKSVTGGGSSSTGPIATTLFSQCEQVYQPQDATKSFPIVPYGVPTQFPATAPFFEPNNMTDYLGAFTEIDGTVFAAWVGGSEPINYNGVSYSSEGCMNAAGVTFDPPLGSTDPTCKDTERTGKKECRATYDACLQDAGIEIPEHARRPDGWAGDLGDLNGDDGCAQLLADAGRPEPCGCDGHDACCIGRNGLGRAGQRNQGGGVGPRLGPNGVGRGAGGCDEGGEKFDEGEGPALEASLCKQQECLCLATAAEFAQACEKVQSSVDAYVASLGPLPTQIQPAVSGSFTPLPPSSASPNTFGASCSGDSDCPQYLGQTCIEGRCTCPPTTVVCGTGSGVVCADVLSDPSNCGACGAGCDSGICTNAVCSP
jgi:hypothetical protein